MDALVDRSRTVDGKPTSLLDLGYNRIGLDDSWQECGAGVNGSFHVRGRPETLTFKLDRYCTTIEIEAHPDPSAPCYSPPFS